MSHVGSTLTRLHISTDDGNPHDVGDFADATRTAVGDHVFTDYPTPTSRGLRSGFARPRSPLVLPVDVSNTGEWVLQNYVALAWRQDDKKVPPKRLKARVEEAKAAWCAANNREKCPRLVVAELKETAELEMLPRCMPTSKVVSIVWNHQEGWILLSTRSAKHVEAIRKLLHRAFGVVATEDAADCGLDEKILLALGETEPLVVGSVREASREVEENEAVVT